MPFKSAAPRFFSVTRAGAGAQSRLSIRTPFQRRWQTAAADPLPTQSAFQRLWNSPIGPKTVHFWAPVMKWGVVLAGVSDFFRPASDLSLTQNLALLSTGAIWTRWCFVIRPQNLALAAVNFLLFCVGATQVGRVLVYKNSVEGKEGLKQELKKQVEVVEGVVKDPKGAVKKAESV